MKDGEIIPGERIGDIMLGISKEELLGKIGERYSERNTAAGLLIESGNTRFWIGEDETLIQIGVGKGFLGKLYGKIGIGSTLRDVKTYMGGYDDSDTLYVTYGIEGIEGFYFECEDEGEDEEWDELTDRIEYMYVYKI